MDDNPNTQIPMVDTSDAAAPTAEVPSEPFACPNCGQLLAPTCRVCVACRQPIDLAAIARKPDVAVRVTPEVAATVQRERVPFPWRLLFIVVGAGMFLGIASVAVWGEEKGPVVIQSLPVFAGIWVFFDAVRRRLPRPLRWGVGTMLLLAVFLPWYLARRSKPQATVVLEAELTPGVRALLIALLMFLLMGLVLAIMRGPQPKVEPTPPPKTHPNGNSTQVRLQLPKLPAGLGASASCSAAESIRRGRLTPAD